MFNDLDNYSLKSHTHDSYVTSDQVTTIVSNNISNGTIEVGGSMFKSVTTYTVAGNTAGKTISGKGMVTIGYNTDYASYIVIDGGTPIVVCTNGSDHYGTRSYLFSSSVKVYNGGTNSSVYIIQFTVALFND